MCFVWRLGGDGVCVWRAGVRVRGGWGDGLVLWLRRAVCLWHHGFPHERMTLHNPSSRRELGVTANHSASKRVPVPTVNPGRSRAASRPGRSRRRSAQPSAAIPHGEEKQYPSRKKGTDEATTDTETAAARRAQRTCQGRKSERDRTRCKQNGDPERRQPRCNDGLGRECTAPPVCISLSRKDAKPSGQPTRSQTPR